MEPLLASTGNLAGVHVRTLPPATTLLVRTNNSSYRIVVMDGSTISVQGGAFFPLPAIASLGGATMDGGILQPEWIVVGFRMAIRTEARAVVTSLVRAILVEGAAAEASKATSIFVPASDHSPADGPATACGSALSVDSDCMGRT